MFGHQYLRLYVNYFQPSMRLKRKERCGARVKKQYEPAETPYRKLLRSPHLSRKEKKKLTDEYNQLNPAELKRRIEALQDKHIKSAARTRQKQARKGLSVADMPATKSPWQKSNTRFYNQKHLESIPNEATTTPFEKIF